MGITDLNTLLKTMNSQLNKGEFVFCVVSEKQLSELKVNSDLSAV